MSTELFLVRQIYFYTNVYNILSEIKKYGPCFFFDFYDYLSIPYLAHVCFWKCLGGVLYI